MNILAFIRSFFAPTVDTITGSLQRTVAKLEEHAAAQLAKHEAAHDEADKLYEAAAVLRQKAYAHDAEAMKASSVASKVKALLS